MAISATVKNAGFLCQTATVIIWPLGKRKKRPKPKPTAAAATPNEPRSTKRARRTHSVHEPRKEPLSFRKSRFRAPIYRRRPYCVTIFRRSLQIFEVSRFLPVSLCFQNRGKLRKSTTLQNFKFSNFRVSSDFLPLLLCFPNFGK